MPELTAPACDPARSPLASDASTECTPVGRLKVKAQRLSLGETKRCLQHYPLTLIQCERISCCRFNGV